MLRLNNAVIVLRRITSEFAPALHRSTAHDASEDTLSIFELRNAVFQELPLTLRAGGLRRDCLYFGIRQFTNSDRVEDLVDVTDHMAFNDLGRDVGDECLLGNLDGGAVSEVRCGRVGADLPCRLQVGNQELHHS